MKTWLVLVVVCLIAGFFLAGGPAEVAGQARKPAVVSRGDLVVRVVATGSLTVPHQVDLSFATAGTMKEIKVARGDRVSKGQALARLDDASFQDAVKRQELQLQLDQKTLELAQLDLGRALQQLDEATPKSGVPYTYYTDLASVQANITLALNTIGELMAGVKAGEPGDVTAGLSSTQNYLNIALVAASKTQFISIDRQKSVGDALSTWHQLMYQRDRAQVTADKAQVTLETTRFSLEQAKKDLAKTVLTAPFEGIISDISMLSEGSSVTTATRILHLVDTAKVEMNGLMLQLDIAGVKTGQEAIVTLDAFPDVELKGTVTFVSPTATTTSGVVAYPVTITLEPQSKVSPRDGMTASATIVIDQRANVLLIPLRAVSSTGGGGRSVTVLLDERTGKTEQRRVTVGLTDGDNVEVISGLSAGETVLVP